MNSPALHPDSETLLRLADQDLSPEEAAGVEEHLAVCPDCRERLDAVRETLTGYDRFHREVLKPSLPPPPREWTPLRYPQARPARFRTVPWLAAAAAILLAVFLVRRFEQAPSVRAAELLRKAVAADQASPGASERHIRIRSRSHQLDRSSSGVTGTRSAEAAALASMFSAAGYSWETPLSAEAFSRWRDSLPEKQDQIEQSSGVWVVRTSSPAGPVSDAALTLRMADFHAIACTLRLRSSGEVIDITELPALPPEESASAAKPQSALPPPASAPAVATAADELRVIAALHGIGAGLGEPIEVERNDAGIVVRVDGLDQKRRDQIRSALAGMPAVVLRFVDVRANDTGPRAKPSAPAAPPDKLNPLLAELADRPGVNLAIADLSDEFIDATDRASARAFALRALARRFTITVEAGFSPSEARTLHDILRDHAAGLATAIEEIQHLLVPILPSVPQSTNSPGSWQEIAEDLPTQTGRLDRTLNGATDDSDARKAALASLLRDLSREAAAIRELARP